MATRRKGKKAEPRAPADASAAWLSVPVDESAIQTYDEGGLEPEYGDGSSEEGAPGIAGPGPAADGAISFPLEENYGGSDTGEGGYQDDDLDLLCFEVANETFGVDIRRVQEIIRRRPTTELPAVADYISGIISLRGAIVPVIDLRRRLGFDRAEGPLPESRIVVLKFDEKPAGVFVDAVSQKIRLPRSSIMPPPAVLGNSEAAFLLGICRSQGRLISVLNPERVMGLEASPGEGPGSDAGAGGAA